MDTQESIDIAKYHEFIGIDPGVKNTLSIVRREEKDGQIIEDNHIVSSKSIHSKTRSRSKRQKNLTQLFDEKITSYLVEEYENEKTPSAKSTDFRKFIKLRFFNEGTECYFRKEVAKMKFRK